MGWSLRVVHTGGPYAWAVRSVRPSLPLLGPSPQPTLPLSPSIRVGLVYIQSRRSASLPHLRSASAPSLPPDIATRHRHDSASRRPRSGSVPVSQVPVRRRRGARVQKVYSLERSLKKKYTITTPLYFMKLEAHAAVFGAYRIMHKVSWYGFTKIRTKIRGL